MRLKHWMAPALSLAVWTWGGGTAWSQWGPEFGPAAPSETSQYLAAAEATAPPWGSGYPPPGYPPAGYAPPGYPPQGYPPQGYPPQGYPPQGSPPPGYPPPGYPPPGFPPGFPPGGNTGPVPPSMAGPVPYTAPGGVPGTVAYPPGMGAPPGMPGPGANAFGPSPADPQFQPYPEISPYDHRFEQHFWDTHDQLWKVETNDEDHQYFVTLEAMIAELRYPGQVPVGNEDAAVLFDQQNDQFGGIPTPFSDIPEIERLVSGGVRARWGFSRADKSAFEVNGWWVSDRTAFEADPRVPIDIAFGSRNGPVVVTFDQAVHYQAEAGATGAEVLFSWSPFLRRTPFEVRMVGGGRWVNVQERFQFLGVQDVLPPVIITPTTQNDFVTIDAKTNTHLGGPQVGIGYSFGGESLFISGRSVFGVMGNGEHISVLFNELPRQQAMLGAIQETESNGHVSPLFETQLHADLRIFGLIPVLRKVSLLEEARLRLGITYLLIGEMARPANSIEYLAFPDHSTVKVDRQKWDMFSWDIGIHWNY